jgi:hypothetical protein
MCTNQPTGKISREIKNLMKGNAIKYMRYKDQFDTLAKEDIEQYRRDVENAYERINAFQGATILFVEGQPYKNLEELTVDIFEWETMKISKDNNDSVLLPGDLNLKFRAVHDHLHYLLQQEFDFAGEYKVYQAQKNMHKSKIGKQILYSEVVLQAAYCEYFGRFADKQKIVL